MGSPVKKIWHQVTYLLSWLAERAGGKIYLPEESLKSGGSEKIFQVTIPKEKADTNFVNDILPDQLKRLQIVIEYKSAYGDKYFAIYTF